MKRLEILILGITFLLMMASCKVDDNETSSTQPPTSSTFIPDVKPSETMCDGIEDKGDYTLVWCDEFNYRGLPDPTKWSYDIGGDGWGNNEIQYYTRADRDNVMVKDNNLVITARREAYNGRYYTSTRLLSSGKAEFTYGYIEFRAKLPEVGGTWPALWMLGNFGKYGWPECGEIDLMEHVANDLNVVHGSIHTTDYNHKDGTQKTEKVVLEDVVNTYHTYAIEWTPKQIRFFIDGLNYFTFNNDELNNPEGTHSSWPFDEPMFFIMNIAVGGWGGTPSPNFTEASMVVDYVRVYQKDYPELDLDHEKPSKITNLKVESETNTNQTILWEAAWDNLGVKGYEIYVKEKGDLGDSIYLGTTDLPKYTITGLRQNTRYEVTVQAVDFNGNIGEESTIEITVPEYPNLLAKIEAEDYRSMEGLGLEDTSDLGGGKNIGWMERGGVLIYDVNIDESGRYRLDYRVSVNQSGASYALYLDDKLTPFVTTSFMSTGGWQNWETVRSESFELPSGTHQIKLVVIEPGSNLNWLQFVKGD